MTLDEWKNVAKTINVLYGSGTKVVLDTKEKVLGWYSCLNDLPCDVVLNAIKNIAMRSKFPPSIAEIREACVEMMTQPALDEQEAWLMVRDGIRNGYYGAAEEFAKFPPLIQKAVVDPSSLSEWALLPSDEVGTVIQSLFKRNYRAVVEREKREALLGSIGTKAGQMVGIAEKVADRLEMKKADTV